MKYVKKLREAGTKEVAVLYVIDEHELSAMAEGCGWIGEDPNKCLKELERTQREKAEKELEKIREE